MTKKSSKYIKFTHDYPKLQYDEFTTIRRRDRYVVDDVYDVKSPSRSFKAQLVAKKQTTLDEIPDNELLLDTDTKSRTEAYKLLNSFYKNKIDPVNEVLTVLYFKKPHEVIK